MLDFSISRRQFLQSSAIAAYVLALGHSYAGPMSSAWAPAMDVLDPLLALALRHGFADHDLGSGLPYARCVLKLATADSNAWRQCLQPGDEIKNWFQAGDHAWATTQVQLSTLESWRDRGLPRMVMDHVWGAPWAHGLTPTPSETGSALPQESLHLWAEQGRGNRRKILLVDHGFPTQWLRELKRPFIHRFHQAQLRRIQPSSSHGAQVLGLLLQSEGQQPGALLLQELPDAILDTMPRHALWADWMDAVCWAITRCEPGDHLIVLLSVVCTDGDRHDQSFMSQSVRALIAHARRHRVRISWVFAAGNSHDQDQNLRFRLAPGHKAMWRWRLPAHQLRASFMECWHDADLGPPEIRVKAPGGLHDASPLVLSHSVRCHPSSGRVQTLFRLPPTWALESMNALAQPGDWRFEWACERAGMLDVHLSMVSPTTDVGRQARLPALPESQATSVEPITLSGLVPWACGAWAAMTLAPDSELAESLNPESPHLASYCGRLPTDITCAGIHGWGVRLSDSKLNPGARVMTRQGHPLYRSTGTSMAVPLTISRLGSSNI